MSKANFQVAETLLAFPHVALWSVGPTISSQMGVVGFNCSSIFEWFRSTPSVALCPTSISQTSQMVSLGGRLVIDPRWEAGQKEYLIFGLYHQHHHLYKYHHLCNSSSLSLLLFHHIYHQSGCRFIIPNV